jgi:hypothetical protein
VSRTVTGSMLTALAATDGEIVVLISLDFSGGVLYITNASQSVTYGGHTYLAMGGLLTVQPFMENADLASRSVDIVVSGVDQTVLALLLTQTYIGRSCIIYLAHLDSTTYAVISDPIKIFDGWMNGGWRTEEERPDRDIGTVKITGTMTDRLSLLEQTRGVRSNIGSHQQVFPGDTFFGSIGQRKDQRSGWADPVIRDANTTNNP